MVHCTVCNVNPMDKTCTNTPRLCFECCTTLPSIHTCPSHFRSLGNSAAAARLLTGMVHAIIADAADGGEGKVADSASSSSSASSASAPPPPGGAPPSDAAVDAAVPDAAADAPGLSVAAGVAEQPPELTMSAMAALLQQMFVAQAADRAILVAVAAAVALPPPAGRPAVTAPTTARTSTAAILPFVPLPATVPDGIPALINPPRVPAHRAAVLDRAAVASQGDITALVNRFSALSGDGESDDDNTTVPPQLHTRTARPPPPTAAANFLPPGFVPQSIGTELSGTQQIAVLLDAIEKQGGKTTYKNFEDFNEALDDWARKAVSQGWTAHQVEAIRAYQALLITQFATSDRMPLKQVLEYHRRWCKDVMAGIIDPFTHGAAMNHDIYYTVTHPLRLTPHGAATTFPQQKGGKAKGASDKKGATADKKTYPAGSCTHHPTSTTHTTAECKKKP